MLKQQCLNEWLRIVLRSGADGYQTAAIATALAQRRPMKHTSVDRHQFEVAYYTLSLFAFVFVALLNTGCYHASCTLLQQQQQ
jgi:hypothetical protein